MSPAERATLDAAVDRVLPGATQAGAAGYMERLIARAGRPDTVEQLSAGLALLDMLAEGMWGESFATCSDDRRDAVLEQLGRVPHPAAQRFLRLLVRLALRGFLCAPKYGGNRGGAGWAFIGFTPHSRTAGASDALQ